MAGGAYYPSKLFWLGHCQPRLWTRITISAIFWWTVLAIGVLSERRRAHHGHGAKPGERTHYFLEVPSAPRDNLFALRSLQVYIIASLLTRESLCDNADDSAFRG